MAAGLTAARARSHARKRFSIAIATIGALVGTATIVGAAAPATTAASPRMVAAITTDIWQLAARPAASADVTPPPPVTSAFRTTDNEGASMDGLDIIVNPVDPGRSYLGVYHIAIGAGRFALRLAASKDLRSWRKIADLDATGGGMGTLRALPGGAFLLAYEAQVPGASGGTVDSNVRLRYYRDPAALLSGAATEERTLPHRLSTSNEGTPDFRSISWRESLAKSVITLGFHYLDHGSPGSPRRLAVDREARGTLAANTWSAAADRGADRALTRLGFDGNHGARRQFADPGAHRLWRIYEAQRFVNVTSSWRLVLYNVNARTWTVLRLRTPGGSRTFANPTLSLLPSPHAPRTNALVMTMFVPTAGSVPGESGEAVSWVAL